MTGSTLTLVGLDIEGAWNLPLLANAAALSGAVFVRAATAGAPAGSATPEPSAGPQTAAPAVPLLEDVRGRFDVVLACETGARSRSIYETPAPRGRVGVLVGNEWNGIPRQVLRAADCVVNVPMAEGRISSVNVAVASAVVLWALDRDLGRRAIGRSRVQLGDMDVLLRAPPDPSEVGSLLRSAWAFGWTRVFLDDPAGAWLTDDSAAILAGRAAARRSHNRLAVIPATRCDPAAYDVIIVCDGTREGSALSRLRFPAARRVLVVFGGEAPEGAGDNARIQPVFVDHADRGVVPQYRHAGSILLSYVSQCTAAPRDRG